ncbi:pantoate--beta-alanine ligase [Bacillus sp. PS06]|uniref:pantoate--beta-alanine ligase n=1 Tax=Bacillus sp. PS06 TaxID=2764176 RepID=UPI00177CEE81|nr:pantoate--beta-alanine ligase [Bacillus sp. PS06]MBD8070220.1 pantoate--beta-alanine ligase [Bacillus sp. PS06]
MKIITSAKELQKEVLKYREEKKSIGFVPTMGYLHEGHMSLVHHARKENDLVIMSVFVNPLQFGPNEDFDSYPRDFERDERLAKNNGVDIIFYPQVEEMYKDTFSFHVKVLNKVNVLCGQKREGHFDGVATVLIKLFNITQPNRAYFGMKDAQQVAIIESIIEDFNFPITLVPVDIVREEDGLAKSSRNVYLSDQERNEAPQLYEALKRAKSLVEQGEYDVRTLQLAVSEHISKHTSGEIDYVEILNYPELEPIQVLSGKTIIAVAVKFTKARLIDNITFDIKHINN